MSEDFWQDMRDEGFMIIDASAQRLAVFATELGQVALATFEDGVSQTTTIDHDTARKLVAKLVEVAAQAKEIDDRQTAEMYAFYAIDDAKRGKR